MGVVSGRSGVLWWAQSGVRVGLFDALHTRSTISGGFVRHCERVCNSHSRNCRLGDFGTSKLNNPNALRKKLLGVSKGNSFGSTPSNSFSFHGSRKSRGDAD